MIFLALPPPDPHPVWVEDHGDGRATVRGYGNITTTLSDALLIAQHVINYRKKVKQ